MAFSSLFLAAIVTSLGCQPAALAVMGPTHEHKHPGVMGYPNKYSKGRAAFVTLEDDKFSDDTRVTGAIVYKESDIKGGVLVAGAKPLATWQVPDRPAYHPNHNKITVKILTTALPGEPEPVTTKAAPKQGGYTTAGPGTGAILVLTTLTIDPGGTTTTTTTTSTNPPLIVEPINLTPCP